MVEDTTTATSNVFSWIRDALFNRHLSPSKEYPPDNVPGSVRGTVHSTDDPTPNIGLYPRDDPCELDTNNTRDSRKVFLSQDDTNYRRAGRNIVGGYHRENSNADHSLFRTKSLGELNETFYRKYELLPDSDSDDGFTETDQDHMVWRDENHNWNNGHLRPPVSVKHPRSNGVDKPWPELERIFKPGVPATQGSSAAEVQNVATKGPTNKENPDGERVRQAGLGKVRNLQNIGEIPGDFLFPPQAPVVNNRTTNVDGTSDPTVTGKNRTPEFISNDSSIAVEEFQTVLTQLYKNTTALKLIQDDFNRRDLESKNREAYYKQRYDSLKSEYIGSLRESKKILDQILELATSNRSLRAQLDVERSKHQAKIRELEGSYEEEISALQTQLRAVQAGYKELEAQYNVLRIRLEFSECTSRHNRSQHYPPPPDIT